MKSLVFLNSHPIQYFVPLYQQIAKEKDFDIEVLYCSDESVRGAFDKGFGTSVKWDIPLLEGYKYVFLNNHSPKKSIHGGMFGLVNLGIISYLFKKEKSILVVHGWGYITHVLAIIFGRLFGHTVCLRAEPPLNQEALKKGILQFIKKKWLGFLFLFVKRFLYIGKQNKLFYESFGIRAKQMTYAPYCVDNDRFQAIAASTPLAFAKQELGIAPDKLVILYSGKYINKKRPMDLLNAFAALDGAWQQYCLVMMGEGELRQEMEAFIKSKGLEENICLTGFVNQQQIGTYYAACDVFVMCSDIGETWGLSVNEAMNFAKPIVVSSMCGCASDLVHEGSNGYSFEVGDIAGLKAKLTALLTSTDTERQTKGLMSKEIVNQYSYRQIIDSLKAV